MTEDGRQKTEDRRQKTEDRRQKTEVFTKTMKSIRLHLELILKFLSI